jgi:hypothetical protein
MAYIHGTNDIIGIIDLSKCRDRTDFGKGFYLADKIGTAMSWASRRAIVSGGVPTMLQYHIDNGLYQLRGKKFEIIPTLEWLDFICFNRRRKHKDASDREPRHDYHWVSGPIADDKIVDVVDEYLENEITAEEAVRRSRALQQTFQLSIHTQEALNFIDDVGAQYKQYKNGRWTKDWRKR